MSEEEEKHLIEVCQRGDYESGVKIIKGAKKLFGGGREFYLLLAQSIDRLGREKTSLLLQFCNLLVAQSCFNWDELFHVACDNGYLEAVKILVRGRDDVDPGVGWHRAREAGNTEVVKFLEEWMEE